MRGCMGGMQPATAAAANGALSTYQWRAAACALIIHVITIERTHPGRSHGVFMAFTVRPGWKPPPPDQSRNCRPDKQLKAITRNPARQPE